MSKCILILKTLIVTNAKSIKVLNLTKFFLCNNEEKTKKNLKIVLVSSMEISSLFLFLIIFFIGLFCKGFIYLLLNHGNKNGCVFLNPWKEF